jgi:restriction system protein
MQEETLKALVTLWEFIWLPSLLVILALVTANSRFKAFIERIFINLAAWRQLDKESYYRFKNFNLPTEEGSIPISQVIISVYGVFVVEIVNMRGQIYGSVHNQQWTQQINRRIYKFPNPLRQHKENVRNLTNLLGLYDHQVHSLIVFIGDSTFKSEMPENITHGLGYIRYIKSKTDQVIPDHQALEIVEAIESGRLADSYSTNWGQVRHILIQPPTSM